MTLDEEMQMMKLKNKAGDSSVSDSFWDMPELFFHTVTDGRSTALVRVQQWRTCHGSMVVGHFFFSQFKWEYHKLPAGWGTALAVKPISKKKLSGAVAPCMFGS